MPLSERFKLELIEQYLPILLLSKDEPSLPVSIQQYVESAALWDSEPPNHPRSGWGQAAGSDRRPLIERGGISLNPAHDVKGMSDPDGDGVAEHYIAEQVEKTYPFLDPNGRELWFDNAGWQNETKVTPDTVNARAADDINVMAQPRYSAEVWSINELRAGLGDDAVIARFGLGPQDRPASLEGLIVIVYRFLFPVHRQPRKLTAMATAIDAWTGDYEGDWTSYAVIGHVDGDLGTSTAAVFKPLFAAYGERWRGTTPDLPNSATERMMLKPWSEVLLADQHGVAMVAKGTHNLYSHDYPKTSAGSVETQWFDWGQTQSEPANSFARDAVQQPYAAVFALKIVAGALIGGPLGALAGVLASAAEGAWADEEGLYEVPEAGEPGYPDNDPPFENKFDDPVGSDAVSPDGVTDLPLFDPAFGILHHWANKPEEALMDGSLLFAPVMPAHLPSYAGRWGVVCSQDGFRIRSGMHFPDYRSQIVDALLKQL